MNTIQSQQSIFADLIEPNPIDPHLIEPHLIEPNLIEPNLIEPHLIEPHLIEPNLIEPNLIEPNPINLNKEKQDELTEIKSISLSVDRYEEALREKISAKILELHNLKKEYINIMDQYNHIIRLTTG